MGEPELQRPTRLVEESDVGLMTRTPSNNPARCSQTGLKKPGQVLYKLGVLPNSSTGSTGTKEKNPQKRIKSFI